MFANVWPWIGVLALGALHGINPAMGWLFAVALGLQRGDRRAVWGALLPLGAGHLLAIVAALAAAAVLGLVVPIEALRLVVATSLLAMGILQLGGYLHPRRGGMRVGARELVLWSFMMASAHGAGLMALPLVMAAGADGADAAAGAAGHAGHLMRAPGNMLAGGEVVAPVPAGIGSELAGPLAAALHTAGYLLVMGLVAMLVYEKLGLRMLRKTWINLDLIWGVALIVTAVLTFTL